AVTRTILCCLAEGASIASQVPDFESSCTTVTIALQNELQAVRVSESGDDQAHSLLESIFLFFHGAAGYGGDRLRFQSHHQSEPDPPEDSTTSVAVFSCSFIHGMAGVLHLAELSGTNAQGADSPGDRMVWRWNGSAHSAGGSGHCLDDGQIRHDAIENEPR